MHQIAGTCACATHATLCNDQHPDAPHSEAQVKLVLLHMQGRSSSSKISRRPLQQAQKLDMGAKSSWKAESSADVTPRDRSSGPHTLIRGTAPNIDMLQNARHTLSCRPSCCPISLPACSTNLSTIRVCCLAVEHQDVTFLFEDGALMEERRSRFSVCGA